MNLDRVLTEHNLVDESSQQELAALRRELR
jgi:hypothetical protein